MGKYRGYTDAQNKATQRYVARAYDRFVLTIRKDSTPSADDIRAAAAAAGESANEYIRNAIRARMEAESNQARENETKSGPMVL